MKAKDIEPVIVAQLNSLNEALIMTGHSQEDIDKIMTLSAELFKKYSFFSEDKNLREVAMKIWGNEVFGEDDEEKTK